MRIKIIALIAVITVIIMLALFGFGLKERALKGIVEDVSEYNCGKDALCTSCIIDGYSCSCGEHTCNCGNETVNKKECDLFSRSD